MKFLTRSINKIIVPNYLIGNDRLQIAYDAIKQGLCIGISRLQELERIKYIIDEEIKRHQEVNN
jgi:hypothetical protein